MIDTFHCPKCNRLLRRSGEVEIENTTFPVFQCDECSMPFDFGGQMIDSALTFAVDAKGQPFDPASADGKLHI
jgi:transcription elongation factor Elf1